MEEKTLMEYLSEINTYKEAIRNAINAKGGDNYMDNATFSQYAEKISALQLGSGDAPSTPAPSNVDYIYSNGYLTKGTKTNEIVNLVPYEINLTDGECSFELTCPVEYKIYEGSFYDVVFTVEVPAEKYEITKFVWLDEMNNDAEMTQEFKVNPRYNNEIDNGIVVRNGVAYKSYTRVTADGLDKKSKKLYTSPIKHIITIKEI